MDAAVKWVDVRERLPEIGYPVAAAVSGRYRAEPSRFALSSTSGPFALDRTYEFKPDGAGWTVSFSF